LVSGRAYIRSIILSALFGVLMFSLAVLSSSADFLSTFADVMRSDLKWPHLAYSIAFLWIVFTFDFFSVIPNTTHDENDQNQPVFATVISILILNCLASNLIFLTGQIMTAGLILAVEEGVSLRFSIKTPIYLISDIIDHYRSRLKETATATAARSPGGW
jgi:hypothetical protein